MPFKDPEERKRYAKEYRKQNRGRYREYELNRPNRQQRATESSSRSTERMRKRKMDAFQELGGMCVDCGITDWRVIQFDHDKGRKRYDPAACPDREWEEEKKWLTPRCANCHQIKTYYSKVQP